MVPIIMPQIGQDITKGSIIEWRKRENDPVQKGEVILVVESEKAAFDVEAEESGVLLKILYAEGEQVQVLEPVGFIGRPGESVSAAGKEGETERATTASAADTGPSAQPARERKDAGEQKLTASPSARRIAQQRGISLERIRGRGTGPRGRIIKRDVLACLEQLPQAETPAPTKPEAVRKDREIPFSKVRRITADKLTLSKQTIPHFYLFSDVDMEEAMAWRAELNRGRNTRVTVTDLIVLATARALREYDGMNAHVGRDKITIKGRINIGLATATQDGLLVPVIEDTDEKDILAISQLVKRNAELARRGKMAGPAAGSFTVTSLGMLGVDRFLPIINPPECAILGVGAIEPRVVPSGSFIGVRKMMTLSLACDHRAVDGTYAARFLGRLKEILCNRYLIEI